MIDHSNEDNGAPGEIHSEQADMYAMIDAYWLLRGYTINTQYSSTFTAFYDENALSCHLGYLIGQYCQTLLTCVWWWPRLYRRKWRMRRWGLPQSSLGMTHPIVRSVRIMWAQENRRSAKDTEMIDDFFSTKSHSIHLKVSCTLSVQCSVYIRLIVNSPFLEDQ